MFSTEQEILQIDERLDLLHGIFSQLPPAHYHTLKYLISHLYRYDKAGNGVRAGLMGGEGVTGTY